MAVQRKVWSGSSGKNARIVSIRHRLGFTKVEPFTGRYPSGESYLDVIQRLEPVIIEIERERECVCVVAHQAILRALYGYFQGTPLAVRSRLRLHGLPDLIVVT